MRAFHFINSEYGLENLRKRRLKIATLMELNDPFELFGVSLANEALRRAFRVMKKEFSMKRGLLCFSRDWHNPVQWSHYAANHTGLCLGFDVPDECVGPVTYSRKRLVVEAESLLRPRQLTPEMATKFLFTKYAHWRYENEVRALVTLEERDPEKNMYFCDFSEKLRLTMVIVGAQSTVTKKHLRGALGDLAPSVEIFKARLAFRSFRVVRQRSAGAWND